LRLRNDTKAPACEAAYGGCLNLSPAVPDGQSKSDRFFELSRKLLMDPAQDRLLTILRLDLAAVLRGYFPAEVARELSRECEAVIRKQLETGVVMRRVALTPETYTRPLSRSKK
jgi:hypothetical protein